MNLSERDYRILNNLSKWRFLLAKHIQVLCGFSSSVTMYRRLKTLIENKLIEKKKILYGVPSIYTLTHSGLMMLGRNKRKDKIRVDILQHNIYVVETAIYLLKKEIVKSLDDITSEKELYSLSGFGNRKHQPDFIFEKEGKIYAVEIELSIKIMERLEKNMKDNFLNYDYQIWVIDEKNKKIIKNIKSLAEKYTGIKILYLKELC